MSQKTSKMTAKEWKDQVLSKLRKLAEHAKCHRNRDKVLQYQYSLRGITWHCPCDDK